MLLENNGGLSRQSYSDCHAAAQWATVELNGAQWAQPFACVCGQGENTLLLNSPNFRLGTFSLIWG